MNLILRNLMAIFKLNLTAVRHIFILKVASFNNKALLHVELQQLCSNIYVKFPLTFLLNPYNLFQNLINKFKF